MLTAEQRTELEATGVVRIAGIVDPAAAAGMADVVWGSLARRGVDRSEPSTWPVGYVAKHQDLRRRRAFDAFATDAVAAAADDVLGAGRWHDGAPWGPALTTFPQPGPWRVPDKVWHLDVPGRGDPDRPSLLRLFGYVTDVVPRGGGTVVVEGSHELIRRMVAASPGHDAGSSSEVRKRLMATHPWFAELRRAGDEERTRRLLEDGDEIDGVRVRVRELTAAAGDVVVMLPWTLHSLAMNCAAAPRFMVSHSIHATGRGPTVTP